MYEYGYGKGYGDFAWEELVELKGHSLEFVIDWFKAHGISEDELEVEYYEDCGDFMVFVGGYYSDEAPTIESEDGKVVRWYRGQCWE